MNTFVIVAVSLINLFIALSYLWMLLKKRSQPSLAMWVFFTLAVSMSLITYLKEGNFGFWDNVLNTVDLFLAISVTIFILIWGDKSTRFNRFDLWCLAAVLGIVIFWLISQKHLIANLGIQLILIIAYFPVIKRMLATRKNSEPFMVWIALTIAPLISLITSKGILATIYATRAFVCTLSLLLLMIWLEKKKE
jgi:hypothetical protein